MHLVLLPATEPGDETYGLMPERISTYSDAVIHPIRFPTLVWYNEAVRRDAIAQIRSLNLTSFILVGFSKSGLGAWNLARALPDLVSGTILFDAPVARDELPPWGTAPFYDGDESWQKDQPLRTVREFEAVMPKTHSLVLISGKAFHNEMEKLSQALTRTPHIFLPRPNLRHHWNSGWIEEGLKALT